VIRIVPLAVLVGLASLLASPGASPNGCPAPCSGVYASPPQADLVYVQPAGEAGPLQAWDAKRGRLAFALPAGRASADGRSFFSVLRFGARTGLFRWSTATGRERRLAMVPGRWEVASVSPSGRWVALAAVGPRRTRVAVVDGHSGTVAHRLRLSGRFEVETVSADGKRLFLVQHLADRRYLVRLYDLRSGRLTADPLKGRDEPAVMTGLAWSGLASPDGRWLLTLYLNTARDLAFVHALDLPRASPRCIFLPSGGGALRSLRQYSLALTRDATRLFAANPALGVVAEIGLPSGRVVRTARFAPSAGDAPSYSTLSRRGRMLYVARGVRLWGYDTAHGIARGPFAIGGRAVGVGFSRDGSRVYVVRADGRVVGFAAATGRRL
jgi:DNA-binding beta-propeller fold protein YncE